MYLRQITDNTHFLWISKVQRIDIMVIITVEMNILKHKTLYPAIIQVLRTGIPDCRVAILMQYFICLYVYAPVSAAGF
jgi:hypothetical protein